MLIKQSFSRSQLQLHRNDLTAESAEDTEEEKRERNIYDANEFDIIRV
jgi:hypothetical protein